MSVILAALLLAATPAPTPLLDGRCDEYGPLAAVQWPLAENITVFAWQDEHHVWLCATLPEGSLGVADMVLQTAVLAAPVNLHASAQLGEWNPSDESTIPATANSDKWWNNDGWYANSIRINGMVEADGRQRPKMLNDAGREFQVSKQRFGRGEWQINITLNGIADESGVRNVSVTSPQLVYVVD